MDGVPKETTASEWTYHFLRLEWTRAIWLYFSVINLFLPLTICFPSLSIQLSSPTEKTVGLQNKLYYTLDR